MTLTRTSERPIASGGRRLLDIDAVAEQLSTSVRHLRRLVQERRIPVVRVGRLIRFDPVDLDAWLDEHRSSAEP
jgi:excisionase family DNA binding protein